MILSQIQSTQSEFLGAAKENLHQQREVLVLSARVECTIVPDLESRQLLSKHCLIDRERIQVATTARDLVRTKLKEVNLQH